MTLDKMSSVPSIYFQSMKLESKKGCRTYIVLSPRPNQCYLVLIIIAHLDQRWINETTVASKAPAGY